MILNDSIEARVGRIKAYRNLEYRLRPPDVCCTKWDDEAWMNWVEFWDISLNGFLPYNPEMHRKALEVANVAPNK